jgi:hypothetical protein
VQELDRRIRADLRKMGDFKRVHPMPISSADVPDDLDARLVVLGIDHSYSKEPEWSICFRCDLPPALPSGFACILGNDHPGPLRSVC